MQLPFFLVNVVGWLGFVGAIWALFKMADEALSSEAKNRFAKWLLRVDSKAALGWPEFFADLFDSVFGTRHWSLRCFLRSSIASVVFVMLLFTIRSGLYPDAPFSILAHSTAHRSIRLIYLSVIGAILFNLIPDYLSLLETRFMVRLMKKVKRPIILCTLLLVDAVASYLIFVSFAMVIIVVIFDAPFILPSVREEALVFWEGLILKSPIGVLGYTTYFTSIWLWLFFFSCLGARFYAAAGRSWQRLVPFLDVEHKPVMAVGFIVCIVVTVVLWSVGILRLVL
jgi:hypothetical protein